MLERASARETAARVAAGAVCRQLLAYLGVRIRSGVLALGGVELFAGPPAFADLERVDDASPLRTVAPERGGRAGGDDRRTPSTAGETLGGVVAVVARGVPPGLGSLGAWDDRLDGQLAQAAMAVQAVKAVAIGAGIEVAGRPGSLAHDPIVLGAGGLRRASNHAGGLEGGDDQRRGDRGARVDEADLDAARAAAVGRPRHHAGAGPAAYERSDVTAVPACGVIVEAMVAFVLARALLEKFGGDAIGDTLEAVESYRRRLGDLGPEGFAS